MHLATTPRTHTYLTVIFLTMLATSCSGAPTQSDKHGSEIAPQELGRLSVLDLVLGTERYWRVEAWREGSQNAALSDCVIRNGYVQFRPTSSTARVRAAASVDLSFRGKFGFDVWSSQQALATSVTPIDNKLSRILLGTDPPNVTVKLSHKYILKVPSSGCYASARKVMGGTVGDQALVEYLPNELRLQVTIAIVKSQRFKRAVGLWSACMNSHSFHVSSPAELEQSFRRSYPAVPPTVPSRGGFRASEIRASLLDARCQDTTGYTSVVADLRTYAGTHLDAADLAAAESVVSTLKETPRRLILHNNQSLKFERAPQDGNAT